MRKLSGRLDVALFGNVKLPARAVTISLTAQLRLFHTAKRERSGGAAARGGFASCGGEISLEEIRVGIWKLSAIVPCREYHKYRPANLPPRGLSREESAAYVGVGATKFEEMVGDGRMPKPFHVGGRVL